MRIGDENMRFSWAAAILLAIMVCSAGLAAHVAFNLVDSVLVAVAAAASLVCLVIGIARSDRILLVLFGVGALAWLGFGNSALVADWTEASTASSNSIEALFASLSSGASFIPYIATALLVIGALYAFALVWNAVRTG